MRIFALLPCDSVTIDQTSGKHFIFGHFSSIKVNSFPATHPVLTLFAALTDISAGEHLLQLKFGPAAPPLPPKKMFPWENKPAADPMQILLTQNLNSTGADQKLYLISEIKELNFPAAGSYLLEVVVDNTSLGNVSLAVS